MIFCFLSSCLEYGIFINNFFIKKEILFDEHNLLQSSDDEPREEKDHFVAQLYKFMDDRGTPLNRNPTIANRDIDLYRLFRVSSVYVLSSL